MTKNTKPNNIQELREMVLDTFTQLKEGKIEVSQALSVSKLCDTVIGTVKVEIDYAKLTSQAPQISFMSGGAILEHDNKKTINHEDQLLLTNPPR